MRESATYIFFPVKGGNSTTSGSENRNWQASDNWRKAFSFSQFLFSLSFFRPMAGNYSDKTLAPNFAAYGSSATEPLPQAGLQKEAHLRRP